MCKISYDNGATWPFLDIGSFHEPQLAAWGSNAYFVSDAHGGMALGITHNSGATAAISTVSVSEAEPWITTSGPYVYIAWEQKHTNGTAPIYGMVSDG